MNCTIWRSTSTSAPFSASSASAIVAVVIVCSLQIKVDGSHLNLIRAHDGHPVRVDQPLCGKPLRATPSAPRLTPKDLHHFLGHHRIEALRRRYSFERVIRGTAYVGKHAEPANSCRW